MIRAPLGEAGEQARNPSGENSLLRLFLRGFLYVGFGTASTMVFGLASVMIVARHVTPEIFGTFVLVQVLGTFLARLSTLGINSTLPTLLTASESKESAPALISTALCFQLMKVPVVGALALLAQKPLFSLFRITGHAHLIGFSLLFFALEGMRLTLDASLQGLFFFKTISKCQVISSTLGFLLILTFVLGFHSGLAGLVFAKVLSFSAAGVFAYLSIPCKKKLVFDSSLFRRMVRFGFPLQINDFFSFLFQRLDTLVIGALLGPGQIAYYEIARKIPDSIAGMFTAFVSVFYPFIARFFALGQRSQASRILNHSTRFISFSSTLGAVIALTAGKPIIRFLFSEKYVSSAPVFAVLMIVLNLTFVDAILGYSLVASGDSRKPPLINVAHGLVTVLAMWLFLPALGLIGAATASLIGYLVANPLAVLFLRTKKVDVVILDYLKPLFIFGACWLFALAFGHAAPWERITIVGLFLVGCGAMGAVKSDDVNTALLEFAPALARGPLRARSRA